MKRDITTPVARGIVAGGAVTPPQVGPFTTSASGPRFDSGGVVIPNGTQKVTVAMKFNSSFAGNQGLFQIKPVANGAKDFFYVRMYTTNGTVYLWAADSAGATPFTFKYTSPGKINPNTDYIFVASLDWTDGNGRVQLHTSIDDGVTWISIGNYPFPAPLSGSMGDAVVRFLTMNNSAGVPSYQFIGSVDWIKLYLAALPTGLIPAGAPEFEVTGPAAIANLHSWKMGTDAA